MFHVSPWSTDTWIILRVPFKEIGKGGKLTAYFEYVDYAKLNTDLSCHYRSKEEASTQTEGVNLVGYSLERFSVVRRPLQFQHSSFL